MSKEGVGKGRRGLSGMERGGAASQLKGNWRLRKGSGRQANSESVMTP